MKYTQLLHIIIVLLCLAKADLRAQNAQPDWAKSFHGTDSASWSVHEVITDKHGNSYVLFSEFGYVDVAGQITNDSSTQTILASWDCDGNFRWMKSFVEVGASASLSLALDTMEGIYLSGRVSSAAGGSFSWDTDTSITVSPAASSSYLIKYNSLGQFQWFRTPVTNNAFFRSYDLCVSPSGEVFWICLLPAGTYGGGSITITAEGYYAIQYDALGNFQAAIPFDISPPLAGHPSLSLHVKYDFFKSRFYIYFLYNKPAGNVTVGTTNITQPPNNLINKAVFAAFDKQGANLWVRQASPGTSSSIVKPAFGSNGTVYLGLDSEPGTIFCGDTTTNAMDTFMVPQLMALDTNGNILWLNRASSLYGSGSISAISLANNTLTATGIVRDTLYWGNHKLAAGTFQAQGYLARANAATGAVYGLDGLMASYLLHPTACDMDKNGNIYIGGTYQGTMSFGSSNISSLPNMYLSDQFLVKYRNVPCNCNLLQPSFSFSSAAIGTFQFTYTGQMPYASISWDFGDGTPAVTGAAPTHVYSQPGTYPVCVTVTNGCGSNTACQYLVITATGVSQTELPGKTTLYPNPASDQITLEGIKAGTAMEIYNLPGRRLYQGKTRTDPETVDIRGLAAGTYLLRLTDDKGRTFPYTFVKQ